MLRLLALIVRARIQPLVLLVPHVLVFFLLALLKILRCPFLPLCVSWLRYVVNYFTLLCFIVVRLEVYDM